MIDLGIGLIGLFMAAGAGRWLLPDTLRVSRSSWAHAALAGILLWGFVGLGLGLIEQLTARNLCLIPLVLSAGWLRGPRPRISRTLLGPILVGCIVLSVGAIDAYTAIQGTDERYLHLGVPMQMLLDEGLVGGLLHPNGSRPLTLHMVYSSLLAADSPNGPGWLNLSLSLALVVLMFDMSEHHLQRRLPAWIGVALLAGSTTFHQSSGQAANDLPTAFALLCAMDAALRGCGRGLALAAAAALSIKYTAASALVGIFLIARMSWKHRFLSGFAALALVSPWWFRNIGDGLHPLFPFTGWPEPSLPFQYLEKYGAGRSLQDFLMLPWNTVMTSDIDSMRFLGRLHPLFLFLGLPALTAWKRPEVRPWIVVSCAGATGWAMGPHWIRYLLPTLPIIGLMAGAACAVWCTSTRLRAGLALVWAAGLWWGAEGVPEIVKDRLDHKENADISGEEIFEYSNRYLPNDATVALLFSWGSFDVERKQILGSVEDHVPTRHFLLRHGENSVDAMVQAGATHAVVRHTIFLSNAYPFLSPEELQSQFNGPVADLNDLLLMKAELLFQYGSHRVYKLPSHD
jgi:hypothetical protein